MSSLGEATPGFILESDRSPQLAVGSSEVANFLGEREVEEAVWFQLMAGESRQMVLCEVCTCEVGIEG